MYDAEYGYKHNKTRSALLDDECVKCGSFDNTYRFHDWCDLSDIEHLHYSCYACGYAWAGQTIEQMRKESGYFDGYKDTFSTMSGMLLEADWSDWDNDLDYRVAHSETSDEIEYLGSYEREDGPVVSER